MIPDVGWARVGEWESGRVGDWESGRVGEAQFPLTNFLLLVDAIEQPKSAENPDKMGNSGVSIGEYHKYI